MDFISELNGWVTHQLGDASGAGVFAFLFLGGLLASLLPCVYPLYPITAAILRARGGAERRFVHPLAYYLGISGMYCAFGISAAVLGGAFNEVLRLPGANLAIGAVVLVLALATAGYLELPQVGGSGDKQREGVFGTVLMGAGAGLLSSACVGPVVVSILVAMAANTASITTGVALTAALKMSVFGLGLGLPVLAIGLFGLAVPKGGRWMVTIQRGFGLLIGVFAWGYFVKGLEGLGFAGDTIGALGIGAALVVGAAFLLQSAELPSEQRTKRALLVLVGVTGVFVMGRQLLPMQGSSAVATAKDARGGVPVSETDGDLTWYLDKEAAYTAAARLGRPVFVDFYGSWCTNCKAFQEKTRSDPKLKEALSQSVLLKVYDTSPLFTEYKNDERFPELKVGLPFFLITNPEGHVIYKTNDFTKVDEMTLFLDG